MKRVILIIMMIGIVGFGCVPTAAPATPATNPVQELQTWRTTMDTWKVTVADPAIAKINAQVAGANYQPQIDAAKATIAELQKGITDLTKRITDAENTIKTSGTTTQTNPTVPTNSSTPVTPTQGGTVTFSIYSAPQQGFVYTPGEYTWFLQLVNRDTMYHKVFLGANLSPSSNNVNTNGIVGDNLTNPTNPTKMVWQTQNGSRTDFAINIIPPSPAITSTVMFTSNGWVVLSPGQVLLMPVTLTLVYAPPGNPIWWNMAFNVIPQNYP